MKRVPPPAAVTKMPPLKAPRSTAVSLKNAPGLSD